MVVTGAGGRTGSLVLKKLAARDEFVTGAVIRSEKVGISASPYRL